MSVNVKLAGDGLSFEAEVSVLQAAQIISLLGNGAGQPQNEALQTVLPAAQDMSEPAITEVAVVSNSTAQEPGTDLENAEQANAAGASAQELVLAPVPAPVHSLKKQISPRERLIEVNAKTNAQKILTLGQYLIDQEGTETFQIRNLKPLFVKAGEPAPRNLSRDAKEAVRAGYIFADETEADHYHVSNKGIVLLQTGFKGEGGRGNTGNGAKKRPHTTTPVKVSDKVKKMPVTDAAGGLPNYRTLQSKSDRLIWILAYGQTNGVETMTAKDIEDVARRLSDNIPARQVVPFTMTAVKKAFISKTAEGYRLLYDGQEYLKSKR